jgi:hypothetical protein
LELLISILFSFHRRNKALLRLNYFKEAQENSNSTFEGFLPTIENKLETTTGSIVSLLKSPDKKAITMDEKKELWLNLRNKVFPFLLSSEMMMMMMMMMMRLIECIYFFLF